SQAAGNIRANSKTSRLSTPMSTAAGAAYIIAALPNKNRANERYRLPIIRILWRPAWRVVFRIVSPIDSLSSGRKKGFDNPRVELAAGLDLHNLHRIAWSQ